MNLTLEDLEADEVEDENWQQGLSTAGKSDTKVTASGKKTRVIPRRRVAEKKAAFSDESEWLRVWEGNIDPSFFYTFDTCSDKAGKISEKRNKLFFQRKLLSWGFFFLDMVQPLKFFQ